MKFTLAPAILTFALALAACGETGEDAEIDMSGTAVGTGSGQATAEAPAPTSTLPAPDQALFTEVFAETCEGAEPVSNAVCRRAMGADTVSCEFGLGEDQYLRHDATMMANDDNTGWMLQDAEALCAEHGAHHVDN